jgi:REP element-mobilizing transposase RayT
MGYHITWGTYGARLHGSSKPHVDLEHNEYGTPFPPADPAREQENRESMTTDPVKLTIEQRKLVEESILNLATRYNWTIRSIAIQSDHAHVVLTAMRDGQQLRDALKAVASRALNKRFGAKKWWAEKGSAKYLWERDYFQNAVKYVKDQRDF